MVHSGSLRFVQGANRDGRVVKVRGWPREGVWTENSVGPYEREKTEMKKKLLLLLFFALLLAPLFSHAQGLG